MSNIHTTVTKARPDNAAEITTLPDGQPRLIVKDADFEDVDTLVVIDTSKSMEEHLKNIGDLVKVVDVCIQNDENGVDLILAGQPSTEPETDVCPAGGYSNIANTEHFHQLTQGIVVSDGEFAHHAVKAAFDKHTARTIKAAKEGAKLPKRLSVLLYSDGDFPLSALRASMVSTAKELDQNGIAEDRSGLQFFQAGDLPGVAEELQFWDNELQKAENLNRDMIDHKRHTPGQITMETIHGIFKGSVSKNDDNA